MLPPNPEKPAKCRVVAILIAVLGLFCVSSAAEASCSSPSGNAGDVVYGTNNIMAYCNGTIWVSMGAPTPVSFGTLTSGDFCTATSGSNIQCTTSAINLGSQVSGILSGTYGGTGVNNGANTITLAGNLFTSGAYALTLTTTGVTNVTFPSGTSTLVSTGVTSLPSLAGVGTITSGVWNGTPVTVPYGGTGATSLTGYVYGNGMGAMTASATIPESALSALSANQVLGAITATAPTGISVPSCSTTASALMWTSGTGFGCNTAIVAPAGTLSGTILASNVVTSSLTSVGTIATGVWNGTAITVPYGGTGLTSLTSNVIYKGNGAGNFVASSLIDNGTSVTTMEGFGIGSSSPIVSLDLSQMHDALALPSGTSGARPTGVGLANGEIRYNQALQSVEAYFNGTWNMLLSSGTSGSTIPAAGSDKQIQYNSGGNMAGSSGLVYDYTTGNVGIGTTSPAADVKADIAGAVKVSESGAETCAGAADVGKMRYNKAGGYFEVCSP